MEKVTPFPEHLHRKLWDWLAKHPTKQKWNWPEWKNNGGTIEEVTADCFGCESSYRDLDGDIICPLCRECYRHHPEVCLYGNYHKWNWSDDAKERRRLARIIRDLPVRPYFPCIDAEGNTYYYTEEGKRVEGDVEEWQL